MTDLYKIDKEHFDFLITTCFQFLEGCHDCDYFRDCENFLNLIESSFIGKKD